MTFHILASNKYKVFLSPERNQIKSFLAGDIWLSWHGMTL